MDISEPEIAPEKEKAIPKDGQVMISMLKDMGITDYEPRVINQMLEFSYRYATTILEDARVYSQHANKKAVDLDDVKLSVSMQAEQSFTSPPPRQHLLHLAHDKNLVQLPQPHSKHGLRLPPDRHCLTNTNYRLCKKSNTSGFDFGVQQMSRAGGGGQVLGNMNSVVLGGKMNSQQAIITTDHMRNGTSQPAFNIQVHPSYGSSSADSKRKRDGN